MSASFLLAGLGATGCRRPVENIYPFAKMPENYAHGVPQFFATAMPSRRGAVPLVVKSSDGRPTKVEGNPDHPDSNGGTDPFAQASVLSLYDPDRAQRYARNGSLSTKAAALDALATLAGKFGNGDGVAFLHGAKQLAFPRAVAADGREISRRRAGLCMSRWIWTGRAMRPRWLTAAGGALL